MVDINKKMDPIFNYIDSEAHSDLQLMDLSSSFSIDSSSDGEISSVPSPFQRLRGTPLRSFVSMEDFGKSPAFKSLETAIEASGQLLKKPDESFDFDSEEGQRACKKLLKQIEKLCGVLQVDTDGRSYRNEFTQAYKVLYKPGTLCYLTEIIDSAQERIPYLWVNSEKYVFSTEVLEAGSQLFAAFRSLLTVLKNILKTESSADDIINAVKHALYIFDRAWVEFEHMYVLELMVIEADARRFIRKAIQAESEIAEYEAAQKQCPRTRERLVRLIGKINSVANVEGHGRDDLTADILDKAQTLQSSECKAIVKLATAVLKAFSSFRKLLRQYANNIEEVDPQLKNNTELVAALEEFEESWSKGKAFLMSSRRCEQLTFFSQHLEEIQNKYQALADMMECCDAELFMVVPALLVALRVKDNDHDLCRYFCPAIADETTEIGQRFAKLKSKCKYMNLQALERALIGLDNSCNEEEIKIIKSLGMDVQRNKPTQWNQFFNIAIPN